jgi:hypothetical protein
MKAGRISNFIVSRGGIIAVRESGSLFVYNTTNYNFPEDQPDYKAVTQGYVYIKKNNELWNGDTGKKLLDNVAAVKAEENDYALALLTDGTLVLVDQDSGTTRTVMSDVIDFSSREFSAWDYALNNKGELWSYTKTLDGDLGLKKSTLENVKSFSAATIYNIVAVLKNGQMVAWGDNYYGQIGNDSTEPLQTGEHVQVLDNVELAYNSHNRTYAVRQNGEIWAWGDFNPELRVPRKYMDAPSIQSPRAASGNYKNASAWAIPELEKAEIAGLVEPVATQDFAKPITRELFCAVVTNYYESLTGGAIPRALTNPFTDTTNDAILKAYSLGIVLGKSQDKFKPKDLVTREEMSVMLKRALDKAMPEFQHTYKYIRFEDESKFSDWALEANKYLRSLGVITGDSKNNFNPKSNASIQESVIMTYRMLEKSQ